MRQHIPLWIKRPVRARLDAAQVWNLRRRVGDAIFVWIPKTAGSSVWNALRDDAGMLRFDSAEELQGFRGRGPATFAHMSLSALLDAGRIERSYAESAFKFAFVRNPFDRLVSLFAHLRDHGRISEGLSFEAFVERVAAGVEPIGLVNFVGLSQANPQVAWLRGQSDTIAIDFVGRYEELCRDFDALCTKLGVESQLRHMNRSHRDPGYRSYYTRASRSLVERIYQEDLETFGYSF